MGDRSDRGLYRLWSGWSNLNLTVKVSSYASGGLGVSIGEGRIIRGSQTGFSQGAMSDGQSACDFRPVGSCGRPYRFLGGWKEILVSATCFPG